MNMVEPPGTTTERERSESSAPGEDGTQVAAQAARKAADTADQARQQAQEFTDEQMRVGADQMERVSSAIGKAADDLASSSPLLSHYARSAASGLSRTAEQLRHRRSSDLLRGVRDYASREPVAFFGAAVIAGFALSRFLKSSDTSSDGERANMAGHEDQGG